MFTQLRLLTVLFIFPLFAACVQLPTAPNQNPAASPTPAPGPELGQPTPATGGAAGTVLPHLKPDQSAVLLAAIRAELPNLDKAAVDMRRFCPGYDALSSEQRVVAWGHLTAAAMLHESGLDDAGKYIQLCSSMTESNGVDSIGPLQLSYGDTFCPHSKAEGNLCDFGVNVKCGVKIMGMYTKSDAIVAGGGYVKYGAPKPMGLAKYWSVVRVPDPQPHINSKGQRVQPTHHLSDIMRLTSQAPGCK